MTSDGVPIYVIEGSTGEYSDHHTWPVCWRLSRDDAEAMRNALQNEADAWELKHAADRHSVEARSDAESMLDPSFESDYNGASYYISEIFEDPETVKTKSTEFIINQASKGIQVYRIKCPTCSADPYQVCRAVHKSNRIISPHRERHEAFREQCPDCPVYNAHAIVMPITPKGGDGIRCYYHEAHPLP